MTRSVPTGERKKSLGEKKYSEKKSQGKKVEGENKSRVKKSS